MKRLIPFAIAALLLSSCLKEDAWCPAMRVSFKMEDQFLAGDYDSRVHNDVLLYLFNDDDELVFSRTIPYAEISGGKYFVIDKTDEMFGNITLVAWAVKSGETETAAETPLTVHHEDQHPEYAAGSNYSAHYMQHLLLSGTEHYVPHHHERYLGTLRVTGDKIWDATSTHDITMTPAPGRIVVNIHDPNGWLTKIKEGEEPLQPYVVIEGGMSHMGLGNPDHGRTGRIGYGTEANVRADLIETPAGRSTGTRADGPLVLSTGQVGVLPSQPDKPLTVRLMFRDKEIKTFTINAGNTSSHFTALHSGDYIQFSYELEDPASDPDPTGGEFDVTINGFEVKSVSSPGGGL